MEVFLMEYVEGASFGTAKGWNMAAIAVSKILFRYLLAFFKKINGPILCA